MQGKKNPYYHLKLQNYSCHGNSVKELVEGREFLKDSIGKNISSFLVKSCFKKLGSPTPNFSKENILSKKINSTNFLCYIRIKKFIYT